MDDLIWHIYRLHYLQRPSHIKNWPELLLMNSIILIQLIFNYISRFGVCKRCLCFQFHHIDWWLCERECNSLAWHKRWCRRRILYMIRYGFHVRSLFMRISISQLCPITHFSFFFNLLFLQTTFFSLSIIEILKLTLNLYRRNNFSGPKRKRNPMCSTYHATWPLRMLVLTFALQFLHSHQ